MSRFRWVGLWPIRIGRWPKKLKSLDGSAACGATCLSRLKLAGIRGQLDSLLDEAARSDLEMRQTLALLCEREIARKDTLRIDMALKLAHFLAVRDLESFDFSAQPSIDPKQINGVNSVLTGTGGFGARNRGAT